MSENGPMTVAEDSVRDRQLAFNRWWRDHYRTLHIDRKPANEQDRIRSMYQCGFFAGYEHVTQQHEPIQVGGDW